MLPVAFFTSASAVEVIIDRFVDGEPAPFPYVDVSDDTIPEEAILNVSQAPFIDYLIPSNSGAPAIIAQKETGLYLSNLADPEIFTNMGSGGGANSLFNPDRYQTVFKWEDGVPLPFGQEFFGVSWANWNNTQYAEMTTRISLPNTDPVRVWHFFNDGWNYADGNHTVLTQGHEVTVIHYSASGDVVSSQTMNLMSGGASGFFGDHRQFYSMQVNISGHNAGDWVDIMQRGGNIGYKGTVVQALDDVGPPTTWAGFDIMESGYVDTGSFMGMVYPLGDWVYVVDLAGWAYLPEDHVDEAGAWTFIVR